MFKQNRFKQLALALALAGGAVAAMPSLAGVSTQQLAQQAIAPAFPGNSTFSAVEVSGNYDPRAIAINHLLSVSGSGAGQVAVLGVQVGAHCPISSQQIAQNVLTGNRPSC